MRIATTKESIEKENGTKRIPGGLEEKRDYSQTINKIIARQHKLFGS